MYVALYEVIGRIDGEKQSIAHKNKIALIARVPLSVFLTETSKPKKVIDNRV